jgi:hypothetical protein
MAIEFMRRRLGSRACAWKRSMASVRSVGGSIIKRHVEARKDRSGRSVHRFHLLHPLDSGENMVFGGCCRFGWGIEGVVGDRECVW